VLLFDRSRTLSLHLFEHVHGESRARGGAMVDLLETFRAGGFEPIGPELPDHLPMLLEFLATRPLPEARDMLADAVHIFVAFAERLERRGGSPYAPSSARSRRWPQAPRSPSSSPRSSRCPTTTQRTWLPLTRSGRRPPSPSAPIQRWLSHRTRHKSRRKPILRLGLLLFAKQKV
jgi:hypothetical protein